MNAKVIFPGTFCPPTYGHVEIVKRAAELFPELIVLCSVNPEKNHNWFTPDECVDLWAAYELPVGVTVTTLEKFLVNDWHGEKLIMVRGVRDDKDFEHEKSVIKSNFEAFGVSDYYFILTGSEFTNISSSRARALAEEFDIEHLPEVVAPLIVTKLLEKVMEAKNVIMVVGRPGCGKTTFLKELAKDSNNHVIFTDDFNHHLAKIIREHYPHESLFDAGMNHEFEVQRLLAPHWFFLLKMYLKTAPKGKNIFIEIAYGLSPRYSLFRYVGGKILRVYCSEKIELERLDARGTPEHRRFLERLPSENEVYEIVKANHLKMNEIENNGDLDSLVSKAREFKWRE